MDPCQIILLRPCFLFADLNTLISLLCLADLSPGITSPVPHFLYYLTLVSSKHLSNSIHPYCRLLRDLHTDSASFFLNTTFLASSPGFIASLTLASVFYCTTGSASLVHLRAHS